MWRWFVFGNNIEYMECIVIDNTFATKRSTLFYWGELECRTVLVYGLYLIVTHGSMKAQGCCNGHTPVYGMDLSAKLHLILFRHDRWRGTPLLKPPVPIGHQSVSSMNVRAAPQKSMSLPVGWDSERYRHYFALDVTMIKGSGDHSGVKCANWIMMIKWLQ